MSCWFLLTSDLIHKWIYNFKVSSNNQSNLFSSLRRGRKQFLNRIRSSSVQPRLSIRDLADKIRSNISVCLSNRYGKQSLVSHRYMFHCTTFWAPLLSLKQAFCQEEWDHLPSFLIQHFSKVLPFWFQLGNCYLFLEGVCFGLAVLPLFSTIF